MYIIRPIPVKSNWALQLQGTGAHTLNIFTIFQCRCSSEYTLWSTNSLAKYNLNRLEEHSKWSMKLGLHRDSKASEGESELEPQACDSSSGEAEVGGLKGHLPTILWALCRILRYVARRTLERTMQGIVGNWAWWSTSLIALGRWR